MAVVNETLLRRSVRDDDAWGLLVDARATELRHFLDWAAACEAGAPETSLRLRLRLRSDVVRCRSTLNLFDESWWGVVVYSCFDSAAGTRVAAPAFHEPLPAGIAQAAVDDLEFPRGSVRHHRTQSGLRGAKASLVSSCQKADQIEKTLTACGPSFDDRFRRLDEINVRWWGRTTHFDVLLRAGALAVGGECYGPDKAYLAGSQGPAAGFEKIFGVKITSGLSDVGEAILRRWTSRWMDVARNVDVDWDGDPYYSGDLENALCIFQGPPHTGLPNPGAFAAPPELRLRGKAGC